MTQIFLRKQKFSSVLFMTIFLTSGKWSFAQEACYTLGHCVNKGEVVGSEIVPQERLAKCQSYKAKAKATPGLIIAERRHLVSASKCWASHDIFAAQLTDANLELGKERERRESAESKTTIVIVVAVIATAAALVGGFFLGKVIAD